MGELGGMVDAGDLKSPARMGVRVRVPQFAPQTVEKQRYFVREGIFP